MSKVAVVYWSGTGNTEAMAQAIAEGAGDSATLFSVADFSADQVADYDAFAFGSPAMGDEEIEQDEFAPVWEACVAEFDGKPVALFGSYAWAEGAWMDTWKEDAEDANVNVVDTVIAYSEPDDDAIESLKELGKKLAE